MSTKYQTDICANCGASSGLHQWETELCPLYGREEMREGRRQEWGKTTFEDAGEKRLKDAAPELLAALKELHSHTPDIDDLPGTTDFQQSLYKAIIEAKRLITALGGW